MTGVVFVRHARPGWGCRCLFARCVSKVAREQACRWGWQATFHSAVNLERIRRWVNTVGSVTGPQRGISGSCRPSCFQLTDLKTDSDAWLSLVARVTGSRGEIALWGPGEWRFPARGPRRRATGSGGPAPAGGVCAGVRDPGRRGAFQRLRVRSLLGPARGLAGPGVGVPRGRPELRSRPALRCRPGCPRTVSEHLASTLAPHVPCSSQGFGFTAAPVPAPCAQARRRGGARPPSPGSLSRSASTRGARPALSRGARRCPLGCGPGGLCASSLLAVPDLLLIPHGAATCDASRGLA